MKTFIWKSTGPPASDLARESWMLERASRDTVTALASSWRGPVVVLGYAQDAGDVDLDFCRSRGIPVLRRITGGTGVIHTADLGISMALPKDHPWAGEIVGLYRRFLGLLEPVLRESGSDLSPPGDMQHGVRIRSPICFLDQLADTLVVGGRKAVGCAQSRRRGAVLIHAAVLLGLDATLYSQVFRVPEAEVAAGLAPAVAGGDWRRIARGFADRLGAALRSEIEFEPAPEPPAEYAAPYRTEKWAPVAGG